MKTNQFLIIVTIVFTTGCGKHQNANNNFKSERISKTSSFIVNDSLKNVFPLYGAFEERKWAPGWKPVLIYPNEEVIEEGTTFKIEPHVHGHNEGNTIWIVSKYDKENYLIQYLVSTVNRYWTITVKSESIENKSKTRTTVNYTFTGLNNEGNKLNKIALEKMFENDLQDWAHLINNYLQGNSDTSIHQ